jgi:L,D-transpeptidase YbiS
MMSKAMIKLEVSLSKQTLVVFDNSQLLHTYIISSAKNGAGEQKGSEQTPRGSHIIRAKIGAHLPKNTIFSGRRPTGELYHPSFEHIHPVRDWILTRILWLSGLEVGKNRLGTVDTMRRYIYIHGTSDIKNLGVPVSHGCIRMDNDDIIALFDRVSIGTLVVIQE